VWQYRHRFLMSARDKGTDKTQGGYGTSGHAYLHDRHSAKHDGHLSQHDRHVRRNDHTRNDEGQRIYRCEGSPRYTVITFVLQRSI
ncbi:uncharacterized protein B0I36DRAFT_316128, partial [Microdochium trichocladiopsis]